MNLDSTVFLGLLFGFASVSSLITEAVKKIIADKAHLSDNILAILIAVVVGAGGTAVYYQIAVVPYTANSIIFMVLMGVASALTSMVGYDKVKQVISQLIKKA